MSTPYHSKYLAYELTKRLPADKAEKLSQSLANATVDLNPHQVEAALFAFRSPLSRGAILADEVGLGKTIEAGLIVSQLWAERKRRILCVAPAALRKQWNRELAEKFYIDSVILETKGYNQAKKQGAANPFLIDGQVVIVSYQFASAKIADVKSVPWDLVVIDEAHRLRNVYKKTNKIARNLLDAVGNRPKALLTATPLQNSLMELYGLVSFVDDKIFGSEESFRDQFCKRLDGPAAYEPLKARIRPVCHRTLRRQVTEYIRYPRRVSLTQDFTPTDEEQQLYRQVSAYLQKPDLHALPNSQRQLITLVLRKILASSSFAIGDTLGTMIERLKLLQGAAAAPAEHVTDVVGEAVADTADELEEEWEPGDEAAPAAPPKRSIADEIAELGAYLALAQSIQTNAKGDALLIALRKGFEKAVELGAPKKALVFTESRRTQQYLLHLLESKGYAGQVVLFNGTNSDSASKAIYQAWLRRHAGQEVLSASPSADMRSALVEEFQDRASVMIATESAAEGVNLQFCNIVVNYDLPWNPQRIEQRIGRCHRYGQKHDVVVVNFINRANQADERVFELLDVKLKLFDGVFGASDEVLGALESGIDFEKRIHAIYQTCRTPAEINTAFDKLQVDLEEEITTALTDARAKLLENFDDDVHRKLKMRDEETRSHLTRYGEWLWALTKIELHGAAVAFDQRTHGFRLDAVPAGLPHVPIGSYRLLTDKVGEGEIHYRAGHPLALALVERARTRSLPTAEVEFRYDRYEGKLSLVERLRGLSGWLRLVNMSVSALETEDILVFCGVADDGQALDRETCEKLMAVPGTVRRRVALPAEVEPKFTPHLEAARQEALGAAMARNRRYYEAEMEKLEEWAEDLKGNLDREIWELEDRIRETKKQARLAADLSSKISLQKQAGELERQRNAKRKSLFEEQDRIAARKDALLDDIASKLTQQITEAEVFTIRWTVI